MSGTTRGTGRPGRVIRQGEASRNLQQSSGMQPLFMEVTKTSPWTGITRTLDLDVTLEEYSAWKAGALIQDAMPRLNADEREFIKTGYTAEDWEEIFAQEED